MDANTPIFDERIGRLDKTTHNIDRFERWTHMRDQQIRVSLDKIGRYRKIR